MTHVWLVSKDASGYLSFGTRLLTLDEGVRQTKTQRVLVKYLRSSELISMKPLAKYHVLGHERTQIIAPGFPLSIALCLEIILQGEKNRSLIKRG